MCCLDVTKGSWIINLPCCLGVSNRHIGQFHDGLWVQGDKERLLELVFCGKIIPAFPVDSTFAEPSLAHPKSAVWQYHFPMQGKFCLAATAAHRTVRREVGWHNVIQYAPVLAVPRVYTTCWERNLVRVQLMSFCCCISLQWCSPLWAHQR